MQDKKGKKKVPLAAILIFYILPILIMEFPLFVENGVPRNLFFFSLLLAIIVIIISVRWLGIGSAFLIFVIMVIGGALTSSNMHINVPISPEAEQKSNCNSIAIALWRYGQDHNGHYPLNTDILLNEEYLVRFPPNVISGNYGISLEMKNVPFGSESCAGNFTYVPALEGDEIKGYYLLGYGFEDKPGIDVNGDEIDDHIIIVLLSTDVENKYADQSRTTAETEPGVSAYVLPPLSELLLPHVQDAHATD
jgi:hypothetical protein